MASRRSGRRIGNLDKPQTKEKAPVGRVRKSIDIDPVKLAAAQRVLGTRSETETVDRALELAIGRRRLSELMDQFAARGGLRAYDARA